MSQTNICAILKISRTTYHNYVTNEREMPLGIAKLVIAHFGVDPVWFLFGDDGLPEIHKKGAK